MTDPLTLTTGALTAFSQASQAVKILLGLKISTEAMAAVSQVQSELTTAQLGYLALLEKDSALVKRVDDLEKEIARMEAWDTTKERYELKEVTPGVLVYCLKKECAGGEPFHRICPTCYEKGKRSILQRTSGSLFVENVVCHVCHTQLTFRHKEEQPLNYGKPDKWA